MQTFRTNTGHEVEAATLENAIDKAITDIATLASETLGCRMKLHSMERFTVPRHEVQAVNLILVPDLPNFVACLIQNMPTLEAPFSITANPPTGTKFEIENTRPDCPNFIYDGTFEKVALQHAYFMAGHGAIREGRSLEKIFITSLEIKENTLNGAVMHDRGVNNYVNVTGRKLPNK